MPLRKRSISISVAGDTSPASWKDGQRRAKMMESLGEILKRTPPPKSTAEDTGTSSRDNSLAEGECSLCKGRGWLRFDVPFGHPNFGKLVPCQCTEKEFGQERLARLERYSNLGSLGRLISTTCYLRAIANIRPTRSSLIVLFRPPCFCRKARGMAGVSGP
jgi:hypothetical protein